MTAPTPEERAEWDRKIAVTAERTAAIMEATKADGGLDAIVTILRPVAIDLDGTPIWATETNAPDALTLIRVLRSILASLAHPGTTILRGEGHNPQTPTTPGEEDSNDD